MEQRGRNARQQRRGCFVFVILTVFWSGAFAQIRYSVSEEVQGGTVVGNIANDLALDKNTLKLRGFRIVADSSKPLFEVNQSDGNLYLKKKIDREECKIASVF
uniref:Cadherin N-terminal domain-containing protein n=1 Tax=Oryzias melastigma TaxID=30732 RepID=A0A3B3BC62_ORYME